MVQIAATSQVFVMSHKNTRCPHGLFWKLSRGCPGCLPDSLRGWDGNRLVQPDCAGFPVGEQGDSASGTVVEPRLGVWHSVCSEGMHLACCEGASAVAAPLSPACCSAACGVANCLPPRLPGDRLVPGAWGKTVGKGMAISLYIFFGGVYIYIYMYAKKNA